MNRIVFFKGLLVGISMAVPVGPITILCIRRSLTQNRSAGLATALGATAANGLYAMIVSLGFTALSTFLIYHKAYLDISGGILLLALGISTLHAKPVTVSKPVQSKGLVTTFVQTMLLTLANPMTILFLLAAFSAAGFEGQHDAAQALIISVGVLCGSGAWFILLITIIASIRTWLKPSMLTTINRISGGLLILFGLYFIEDTVRIAYTYLLR